MFARLDEKLDEHAETHEKILAQVIYTNGKVKKLTQWLIILGTIVSTLIIEDPIKVFSFIASFI